MNLVNHSVIEHKMGLLNWPTRRFPSRHAISDSRQRYKYSDEFRSALVREGISFLLPDRTGLPHRSRRPPYDATVLRRLHSIRVFLDRETDLDVVALDVEQSAVPRYVDLC